MTFRPDPEIYRQSSSLQGFSWVYGLNNRFSLNPHWSNEHCSICHDDFRKTLPEEQTDEGYTSLGGQYWVCVRCFAEHKKVFGWSVHNWD